LTIFIRISSSLNIVIYELKIRQTDLKYDLHTVSLPLFILKLVYFIAIINIFTYVLALYAGIPYVLIVLVALIIGYSIFMNKTVLGRHIYAVGVSDDAA